MLTPVRTLALASVLWVPVAHPVKAAPPVLDTAALEFLGFRAGAPLEEIAGRLRRLGGDHIYCRRSKVDRRVTECRAALTNAELGGPVDLWISAMDSLAGVITISGVVASPQLERWKESLEARYGRVGQQVQGTQRMQQWVRRGRMLRLTWRLDRGDKVASVSLVDGHVLDGWGRAVTPSTVSPS
jgi:hypothetical protein